jgi:hypothetical protein
MRRSPKTFNLKVRFLKLESWFRDGGEKRWRRTGYCQNRPEEMFEEFEVLEATYYYAMIILKRKEKT